MNAQKPFRQENLISSITEGCIRCGGLCCRDYYPKLLATGFSRTKKRLLIDESYRLSVLAGIKELASHSKNSKAHSLLLNFSKIDFNDHANRILPQLTSFDDYYKSCSPNGPCGFFYKGRCLIHETKEYKCEAFYCAKSSYKGKASDLQSMIDSAFSAADIFALHLNQVSEEYLLALIRLELALFLQMPRSDSFLFLEPKIIINGAKTVSKVKSLYKNSDSRLEIVEVEGDIEELNRTCLKYFNPDSYDANLVFILRTDEKNLARINNIFLLRAFPSLLFLSMPLNDLYSDASSVIEDSHFHLARFGLHEILQ